MSRHTDVSWMIGGPQGSGVDSSATLFSRSMAVAGFWVYGKREYHSNIKGEHSYFVVRVKDEPVHSNRDPIHLLATFEKSTAQIHGHEIVPGGALIYDPKTTDPTALDLHPEVTLIPLPYDDFINEMAEETGQHPSKLAIMKNVISVAASLKTMGVELEAMEEALKGLFSGRRAKLVPANVAVGKKTYDYLDKNPDLGKFPFKVGEPTPPPKGSRLVINGAAATALGKLKAGCRVQTYYSITPAVDECIFLEEHPEYGTVVFQCEDELAAVNMASGAATTGMRASTSTSGPGFCLMTEGIGWAAINEVPLVVFNYQRGGPSTGLPTRHEQGELLFALHGGHGDFPKIVIAPGDLHECFEDGFHSFNYAERYQTPVIVLVDKAMANNTQSINHFDENGLKIDKGEIVHSVDVSDGQGGIDPIKAIGKYPRFKVTENGISPRPLPGTPGTIYWMTGDEHDEFGHITEEPEIRVPMHHKRMIKLDLAAKEIPASRQYAFFGPEEADLTIVSWGSNKGAILDAMKVLKEQHNTTVNFLQIRLMSPFPVDAVTNYLKKAKRLACVESNYVSQLSKVVRMNTGYDLPHKVLKWTGRPISESEMVDAVLDILKNQTEKVVLTYGH
jgi:2-oxoglutarate/2-oxoacid ferredoxin oxidoreductase subunit alpha